MLGAANEALLFIVLTPKDTEDEVMAGLLMFALTNWLLLLDVDVNATAVLGCGTVAAFVVTCTLVFARIVFAFGLVRFKCEDEEC